MKVRVFASLNPEEQKWLEDRAKQESRTVSGLVAYVLRLYIAGQERNFETKELRA